MAFTYTPGGSSRDDARLLITDTDTANALNQFFEDAEVDRILVLESDNVKRAAAALLGIMATSEVLIQKKIRTMDFQTDGPALAVALQARAAQLRAEADADEGGGAFDYAEWVLDDATAEQRLINQALRGLL